MYRCLSIFVAKYDRKDLLNLKNLIKVSLEYKKAKSLFREASKSKKKTDWHDAYVAYEKYNELYGRDIDALLEFGEICTHLNKFSEAIDYFALSSKYQKHNPFHLVRIGEVYARQRVYSKMKNYFFDLLEHDNKNPTYLINYAIACIKEPDIHSIKKLIETYPEQLQNTKILTRDKKPKKLLDTLRDSLKILQAKADDKIGSIPFSKREATAKEMEDLELSIIYRKGKGGKNSLLNQEQRLGVLLLLYIFPGVTKERIRDEWLKNANTTTTILEELITRKEIEKVYLGVSMYYVTETGLKEWEVEKTFDLIKKIIKEKKKVPFGPIFTDRLVKQVLQWNSWKIFGKVASNVSELREKADKILPDEQRTDMDKFYPEE